MVSSSMRLISCGPVESAHKPATRRGCCRHQVSIDVYLMRRIRHEARDRQSVSVSEDRNGRSTARRARRTNGTKTVMILRRCTRGNSGQLCCCTKQDCVRGAAKMMGRPLTGGH